jgi:hypothetical protein
MKKYVYSPNEAPLENLTTQRADFPAWTDVKPPVKRARDVYKGSSGTFDGSTTNKMDFKDFGKMPARFHHEVAKYVKNPAKFEGISTHAADFTPKTSSSRPLGKHSDPYNPVKDDRYVCVRAFFIAMNATHAKMHTSNHTTQRLQVNRGLQLHWG